MIVVPGSGPLTTGLMIVGEAPGADEERLGRPFVGASGDELSKMLEEVGLSRGQFYVTNVFKVRPPSNDIEHFVRDKKPKDPTHRWIFHLDRWVREDVWHWLDRLKAEVDEIQPTVIIALGNTALWALTSLKGITNWRGSVIRVHSNYTIPAFIHDTLVIPTYHPAAILRMWDWRYIALNDLRRARRVIADPDSYRSDPCSEGLIRPAFEAIVNKLERAINYLNELEDDVGMWTTLDIETRHGQIACLGLGFDILDHLDAMPFCIPFMCVERDNGYWYAHEEFIIIKLLRKLLTHPKCYVNGQNLIYDCQYIARWWGFIPNVKFDTMLAHHVCFAGLPKSLDFLASMYLDHYIFWKTEGKDWEHGMGEDQLWIYNCKDVSYTSAIRPIISKTINHMGLGKVWDFQLSLFKPVLLMMIRGIKTDNFLRAAFAFELADAIAIRQEYINNAVGRELNVRSPKQLGEFFYEEMGAREIINRKTGNPTTDEDALKKISLREPVLRPLCERINEIRSLTVYLSTFVHAKTDTIDKRIRCSYNIAGTTTFRFSSSTDAFGSGLNLQNVPAEDKDAKDKLKKGKFVMPNVRRLFIPDPGYTIIDADLDRADLQVVVEEAQDNDLKAKLREGVDLHTANAADLFACPLNSVSHFQRQMAKVFVHGTNYGGSARTMAVHCAVSVHEADTMQKRWFGAHPGIKQWHRRVENDLSVRRYVVNAFGYRRFFFDRIDSILPEALAWIPQSTVACVINRGLVNLATYFPIVQILLQVHDSLTVQIPSDRFPFILPYIRDKALLIPIPYPEPLTIPVGFKASSQSWGDATKVELSSV